MGSAVDDVQAKVITSNRFANPREVEDALSWGRRYHPEKDLAEVLFMKGVLDRPRVSLVRKLTKMARRRPEGEGSDDALGSAEPAPREASADASAAASAEALAGPTPEAARPTDSGAQVAPEVADAETKEAPAARPDAVGPAPAKGKARKASKARAAVDPDPVRVGRYEILEKVAAGGMGIVFKARHPDLDRLFAVKILTPRVQASEEALARFQREARIAARLDHPNLVRVHDAGTDDGAPYLVMDYVDGPSLERVIEEEGVGIRKAAQLTRALALALHHAHERGVVHRDIKPDNVLVERDSGEPRITDFGIVKDLAGEDDASKLTQTGFTLGSPCYMSPEQAAGKHDRCGPQSDVYSLAATLYQMLTGVPPFQGESVHQIMMKVVRDDPVPVRRRNAQVPLELESICMKALEKEPARRYATARAFAEDLDRFLADEPVEARPAGWATKARRALRRHRGVAALLTVALGLVLAFVWARWRDHAEREGQRAAARSDALRAAGRSLARAKQARATPIERRRAYYEALMQVEPVLRGDPGDAEAAGLKRDVVLALGDHLIESGEASFAEFVFSLGRGLADEAQVASRLEAARLGQWVEAAQTAEREGDLEEARRLYREGLRTLQAAGYAGAAYEEKLRDLEGQLEERRRKEERTQLVALAESAARTGDHAAALQAYRRAQVLAPGDGDLAARVERHRTAALQEVLRARADAVERRTKAEAVTGREGALEAAFQRGDEALARADAAAGAEDFAGARREVEQAVRAFDEAFRQASALRARDLAATAARAADAADAVRFAATEVTRGRELQARGAAQLERGAFDEALPLFEQAATQFRLAVSRGRGKEAVAAARAEAQERRAKAAAALTAEQRLTTFRLAEEDFAQAEALYERGEYAAAADVYGRVQQRFDRVLEHAPATREAFVARAKVRRMRAEAEVLRAREFAPDDLQKGLEAEARGDAALEREDPGAANEAYTDAQYRLRRAIDRALPQATAARECDELKAQALALKRDVEERKLTYRPDFEQGLGHLAEADRFLDERKWSLAKRRLERAIRSFAAVR